MPDAHPPRPGEVVAGYPVALGARLPLASTDPTATVTVVGVARARHRVSQQTAIFLTDAEATRLAGHPGRVDAIGVLAAPGFEVSRLRAAADGAQVLTGDARGRAEYPELQSTRTTLIPVTAAFGGWRCSSRCSSWRARLACPSSSASARSRCCAR